MLEFTSMTYTRKTLTFTIPPGVADVTAFAWKNGGPATLLADDFYLVQQVQSNPTPSVTPAANGCQQLVVPAYFYPPTGPWDQLSGTGKAVAIVVLNPNPGVDVKHAWRHDAPLANARANGMWIVGYSQTDYGARDTSAVIDEKDRYREWYGVSSLFPDEADTHASSIQHYKVLTDYAHAMGGITILNFGYMTDPGFMAIADIAIVFEDNVNVYSTYSLPAWIDDYPANRFEQLIYGVAEDQVDDFMVKSRDSNIGYVWITDDHISNGSAYNSLPSYWSDLNTAVSAGC